MIYFKKTIMRINHIRGLKNNNKHLSLNHNQLKHSALTGHDLRAHLAKSNHDVYESSGSGPMSVFTKPNNTSVRTILFCYAHVGFIVRTILFCYAKSKWTIRRNTKPNNSLIYTQIYI